MYSINGYGNMIADSARTDAYARALREAIKPDAIVVDLGTGTGLFALLACRYGARRVYAIESADVIEVARRIAADNGCDATIEFIHGMSTEVVLPERADVVVSDMRGILPFYGTHLLSVADARRRFLAPAGTLIPARDTVWVACVEAADLHRSITSPWSDNKYGLDMRAARNLMANQWRRASVDARQLMSEPQCCATIDYATVESPDFNARTTARASRAGVAHGLCVWFDATLVEGIHLSNSPRGPDLVYGNAFFPWPEPVTLDAGDAIAISLRATLIDDEYLWTWETRIIDEAGASTARASFTQSDFFGEPLSLAKLRKQSAQHVPTLSDDGRIDRLVLGLMSEEVPLGDIARELASRFPNRFERWQDALARVGELSSRYSR